MIPKYWIGKRWVFYATLNGTIDRISQSGTRKDLNHIERNLDALVQDLAIRCQRNFSRAAAATSRSAVISAEYLVSPTSNIIQPEYAKSGGRIIRERLSSKVRKIAKGTSIIRVLH
jgi:hypothetical protein